MQPLLQWKSIKHSEGLFVVLGSQHAMHMRRTSSVACPAITYFTTLSHKRPDLRQKAIENKMCVSLLLHLYFLFLFTPHHTHTHTHTHTPNQELHMRPHLTIFYHKTYYYILFYHFNKS